MITIIVCILIPIFFMLLGCTVYPWLYIKFPLIEIEHKWESNLDFDILVFIIVELSIVICGIILVCQVNTFVEIFQLRKIWKLIYIAGCINWSCIETCFAIEYKLACG